MYLTEYHHHTDNSFDSTANMFDVCEQAVHKGIDEICFTEHFSVNPEAPTYGHMNFEKYFSQIEKCQRKFKGQLVIKAGIELCEPHLLMDTYHQTLKDFELDFIMGSIHNLNGVKLRTSIEGKTNHHAYLSYFEEVHELVAHADIDVLAHVDLMKRYAIDTIGNYEFTDFTEIIEAILLTAIKRDIGIEINTSGLENQKLGEPFPSKEVLRMYKNLGGEILTIGSDSHRASTVGSYLPEALALAKEIGFKHVYTFERREPRVVEIR